MKRGIFFLRYFFYIFCDSYSFPKLQPNVIVVIKSHMKTKEEMKCRKTLLPYLTPGVQASSDPNEIIGLDRCNAVMFSESFIF